MCIGTVAPLWVILNRLLVVLACNWLECHTTTCMGVVGCFITPNMGPYVMLKLAPFKVL